MTVETDEARLRGVLAETGPVLLDFDGPVCQLYPDDLNTRAAEQLRGRLREYDVHLPQSVATERDPLSVLRYAGTLDDNSIVEDIERTLTGIEVSAAPEAPATKGAAELLIACREAGRPVVIVSNNAAEAIHLHLATHNLTRLVLDIVGRPHARPHEMKPHPRLLESAMELFHEFPRSCVLIGDSRTDVQAARATGLRAIAYVKSPERYPSLAAERPDATVESMTFLADAVRFTLHDR